MKKIIMGACLSLILTNMGSSAALAENQYDEKTKVIASSAKYNKAQQIIRDSEKDGIKAMIELTEIPSPPFKEENRAKRVLEMLQEAGADSVRVDEVGNVIATRKGTIGKKVIAIGAHMDTVFPEGTDVKVKKVGDTYYAPGISDNTRGIVNMIMALQAMEKANIETEADLLFIGTVGEEGLGDLRGVKHLFRDNGPQIDSFIAIDGGTRNRLVFGGIGSVRYKVTFKGPGGHSWGKFGEANPHHAMGRAINNFVNAAPMVTSIGPKTSYNVGRMGGGTSVNSIPFESWMEVDMRSESKKKLNEIEKVFLDAVEQALAEENAAKLRGEGIAVDVKRIGLRPVARQSENNAIVQRAMSAIKTVGWAPKLTVSSTDSNIPISKNIPAVTLSRGGEGSGAHSLKEWWKDVETGKSVEIVLLLTLAEAGMAH